MSSSRDSQSAPGLRGLSDAEAAGLWCSFLDAQSASGLVAFDQLYEAFLPAVVRYCRSRLHDGHLAEDVSNAVFVRLLESRPPLKSSFIGLLFATARNLCATELAKNPLRRPLPFADETRSEADPASELERRDSHAALASCLDRLSEPDRTLVVLHHGEGFTYRQVADVLGLRVALSTFTRRLKRIKDQLLRCLKKKNVF